MLRVTKYFAAISVLAVITTATANTSDWIDLSGWDHALVTGGGQTFSDVLGPGSGIDVTVSGFGTNNIVSSFDAMENIQTGADTGNMTFTFTFNQTVNASVDVQSLDAYESLTVSTFATSPLYNHNVGAVPTQLAPPNSITLTGQGFAFGPAGAARGIIDVGNTSSLTWDYNTTQNDKYEWFRVGVSTVPEPSSLAMLLIGGVAGLRRRRRQS